MVSTIVDTLLVEKASEITDGVQAAQPDDLFCKVALEFAGMFIGIALANLMNVFNPSLILIDGSSRRAGLLVLEPIRQSRAAWSLPDLRANTRVPFGAFGDDATSLRGVSAVLDTIMCIIAKSQRKEKRMKNKGCFRRLILSLIGLLIFTTTLSITLGTTSVAMAATPAIKIMPLGDSITGLPVPGCWRALLWNHLQSTGYTNINFVGTLNTSNACGVPPYDGDNEGHSGYLATDIANQQLLPGWLSATNPDIVVMHLGTNDIWHQNLAPNTILAAYSTLVAQMRANNPHMRILVAQIIPMNSSVCANCAQGVINLNAAIPGWASSITTVQSPVVVVDQWTGFNASTDTSDGVHPNSTTGVQKIANKWYSPLTAQINALNGSGGGSSYYKLVNRNSEQVLDISGASTANGGVAIQWPYNGGTNQQWQEVSTNGGYKLVNRNSGKVLDDPAYSKTTGTELDQWNDTNGSNQWWSLVSAGNGYYNLVNQYSGLYADVSGASTANGASVVLWSSTGGANQQWQLVAV